MARGKSASGKRVLRIAVAQLNCVVGDIAGNAQQVVTQSRKAREELAADVVVFPELALTGYPPEDLLLRAELYERVARALTLICHETTGIDVVVGFPYRDTSGSTFNTCALLRGGEITARYFKQRLPNYGVFDEKRYFVAGRETCIVDIKGVPVALSICEDLWVEGPTRQAAQQGAQLLLNINASPYHLGKDSEREALLRDRARAGRFPIVYVNLVGGQDELVFDGSSLVTAADGSVAMRAPSFAEALYAVEFDIAPVVKPRVSVIQPPLCPEESMYRALVLGVRDYVGKNGFQGAVIGVSGGVDSALTLAVAVDALGPERVEALLMPSRHTADMSVEDARAEAETLGVKYHVISIEPMFTAFLEALAGAFAGAAPDVTEENIQARCRGLLLMAWSNKREKLVLATGNKSEMAVGYATLYGDMAGGFAPLKDVSKTDVYRLATWRNATAAVIPQRVLDRAPSAELAPGQVDQDTLPPYAELDAILERYVERDQSPGEIVAQGFDSATVERVCAMVMRNEYKRRQAAPGVRITRRAFGRDRRYPITSGYQT
jgi:NAD+ synthase (glutamine-hydrolysing)